MGAAKGLTDAKIKALTAADGGRSEHADAVVPGLRLRVGASGVKTFILRRRAGGKVRTVTIGRYHDRRFTLADARREARKLINDIEAGDVPKSRGSAQSRSRARARISDLVPDFLKTKAGLRSIGEVRRIFDRYILPEIGDRLADAVTRSDVAAFLDKIERPTMARAVAAQLSSFYSWALPRLPTIEGNPVRDAGKPPAPKSRDRVLSDAELRAVWNATGDEADPFRAAVRLLMITLQRRDEVFSARRDEFTKRPAVWTIPAQRAKNGIAHVVPLSPLAVKELDRIGAWSGEGLLFPAAGNPDRSASGISKVWDRVRAAVAKELGREVERFTIHDLRRTGATRMQQLRVPLEVTEAVLNHVSGSRAGIVGVYQRYAFADEKRDALKKWARELAQIVQSRGKSNAKSGGKRGRNGVKGRKDTQ